MGTPNLDRLTSGRKELSTLRQLLRSTQEQIDQTVESGNTALLELQREFDELAEQKRELLREIEQLTQKRDEIKEKMDVAENLYGKYLNAIRTGENGE